MKRIYRIEVEDLEIGNWNKHTGCENPEEVVDEAIAMSIVSCLNTLNAIGYIKLSDVQVQLVTEGIRLIIEGETYITDEPKKGGDKLG